MSTLSSAPSALTVIGPVGTRGRQPPGAAAQEGTWLTMDAQGRVTVYAGKVEYGQGVRTGFALEVADELDVPLDAVQVVLADTGLVPWDGGTNGSQSTATVGARLRQAAAAARHALLELAAQRWGASVEELDAQTGYVVHKGDRERQVSYAELLKDRQLTVRVTDDVRTKDPDGFRLMGQPSVRVDAVARVTGRLQYTQDIRLPGMLFGKVLRPPSYGARLRDLDASRAERLPGFVAVVRDGDFAGVIAEREEVAEYALQALRARWEERHDHPSDWDLPVLLKERAQELAVLREEGSLAEGFRQADRVFEEVYFIPYVSNAPMEPRAAVAHWEGDQLTVWASTQRPFGLRADLAQTFGIPEDRIRVIVPDVGGAFGGKQMPDVAVEAARLARAVGRPVRVAYTRAEEFAWAPVRPAAVIEIRSGVKADGTIVAWEHIAYHAGENAFRARRGADTPYNTPNVRIAVANAESPLRTGSYRSLGGAVNHFAREVHMDEIAAALEMDPVELRLRNLSHERLRRALTAAAERFGWRALRQPSPQGVGVAIGYDVGSYVAECVELTVRGREVHVQQVVAGFDCGLVVNPEGVRNQVEGSIMMGLGTALWEAIEFAGGRMLNPSFSRYRVPRITDAPEIEVVLVGDPHTPSTGAGEPAIVPIAAAIANGVFNATGTRIRELPIVPHLP